MAIITITRCKCDRCEIEEDVRSKDILPKGWEWATSTKLLCGDCMRDLDAFLRGAKIDYVAVDRTAATVSTGDHQ